MMMCSNSYGPSVWELTDIPSQIERQRRGEIEREEDPPTAAIPNRILMLNMNIAMFIKTVDQCDTQIGVAGSGRW